MDGIRWIHEEGGRYGNREIIVMRKGAQNLLTDMSGKDGE